MSKKLMNEIIIAKGEYKNLDNEDKYICLEHIKDLCKQEKFNNNQISYIIDLIKGRA